MRSRVKLRVLFALLDEEPLYLADLARASRATQQRVRGAVFGDGETYRVSSSLRALRLVRVREDEVGVLVRLTARGVRVARAWRRESLRAMAGRARSPHA